MCMSGEFIYVTLLSVFGTVLVDTRALVSNTPRKCRPPVHIDALQVYGQSVARQGARVATDTEDSLFLVRTRRTRIEIY